MFLAFGLSKLFQRSQLGTTITAPTLRFLPAPGSIVFRKPNPDLGIRQKHRGIKPLHVTHFLISRSRTRFQGMHFNATDSGINPSTFGLINIEIIVTHL